MKTNVFKVLAFEFILVGLTGTSCVKIHRVAPIENQIVENAFPRTQYNVSVLNGNKYYLETGFQFKVNQSGKVTKLGIKTPEIGTYRVTLWDANNQTILATESCRHKDTTTFTKVAITPIALSPKKSYYITFSIKGDKRYSITPQSGTIPYPIPATNSITLTEYGFYEVPLKLDNGDVPKFPNRKIHDFAIGFPELEFQSD